MADVSIMCSDCGLTFRVSEYALGKPIRCPTCGSQVKTTTASAQSKDQTRPNLNLRLARGQGSDEQPVPVPTKKKKLSLINAATNERSAEDTQPSSDGDSGGGPSLIEAVTASRHQPIDDGQAVKAVAGQNVAEFGTERPWALIVMLIFVPIAAFLRYGAYIPNVNLEIIPPVAMEMISEYGPWLIVGLHVTIVVIGFSESSMDGILCLLVPLFSFYHTLSTGNRPMLRSFLVIALVFLGYDTYKFTIEKGSAMYQSTNQWIEKSGSGK